MKLKQSIIVLAAVVLSVTASAQSLSEGVKMINYERYESAKKILTPLAATDPVANYYLGLAELNLGNVEAAKTIFSKYPDNNANISGMIRIAFLNGNEAGAMQLATNLADKARKRDWEPLKYAADAVTFGVANSKGGDIQKAIEWYKKAIETSDNAELRIAQGDAYKLLPTGGGEAANNYEKAVDKDPKNSLAHSRIGKLWYEAKTYKLALESYEKAKEADPSNPLPYCDLADAYSYVGNYELSKKNLEKCLELSDKTMADQIKYMNVLYLSKDYAGAAQKAQEMINKGSKDPRTYGLLGLSQLELKDSANALKNSRIFFSQHDPKKIFPSDYRAYAKVFLLNNMADSANFYMNKAVSMDTSTNKSDAYRQNAEALRSAREWALSAAWYKKLVDEYPADAKATDFFYYGYTYYYGHDFANAAKAYEQMETKFPDQPSATYWRGRTAAAIDSEAKEGLAVPFYDKWLKMEIAGYTRGSNDLMQAYQYLAIYYYNKNDFKKTEEYVAEIEKLEPSNQLIKTLRDAIKSQKKK